MKSRWQERLIASLPPLMRNDLKKSGILVALSVVMAGVLVKQFVFSGGPSPASAATPLAVTPATSMSAIKKSDAAPTVANPVATWLTQPIKALDRNLFQFKSEFYPRTQSTLRVTAKVVEDELFFDQLAKSMSARADSRKQRQIRVENLQLAASTIKVQSTIMGNVPRALVDGRMIRLGATLDVHSESGGGVVQFRVMRIEARRIVIERDGIEIEVPMGTGKARVLNEEF